VAALADIALATRDLSVPLRTLRGAVHVLEAHGDTHNIRHAQLLLIRTQILSGQLAAAEQGLDRLSVTALTTRTKQLARAKQRNSSRGTATLAAMTELTRAELALRHLHAQDARDALERAQRAAKVAAIPALSAEIERLTNTLAAPTARSISRDETRLLGLAEVEQLLVSPDLIVDACRSIVSCKSSRIRFARRPVLFSLLRALAEHWPDSAPRDLLIQRGFDARTPNASHRARLRVELGRLRKELTSLATIEADAIGFRLATRRNRNVTVLAPAIDGEDAAILALLSDGAAWSTSALALARGESQRSVQRALLALKDGGQVHSTGRARAQRWIAAPIGRLGSMSHGLFAAPPTRS
jgi:hypothetical protein